MTNGIITCLKLKQRMISIIYIFIYVIIRKALHLLRKTVNTKIQETFVMKCTKI